MPGPSFPWDDTQELKNNAKEVTAHIKSSVSATTGTNTKADSYEPEKRYGTGKPYRIEIKGDITSDSRKREE